MVRFWWGFAKYWEIMDWSMAWRFMSCQIKLLQNPFWSAILNLFPLKIEYLGNIGPLNLRCKIRGKTRSKKTRKLKCGIFSVTPPPPAPVVLTKILTACNLHLPARKRTCLWLSKIDTRVSKTVAPPIISHFHDAGEGDESMCVYVGGGGVNQWDVGLSLKSGGGRSISWGLNQWLDWVVKSMGGSVGGGGGV